MKNSLRFTFGAVALLAALTTQAQTLTEVMVLDHFGPQDVLVSPFASGELFLSTRTTVLAADLTTVPPVVTLPDTNLSGFYLYPRRLGFAASSGALFSAGYVDASGIAWHVRRSLDQGVSWVAVDPGWQPAPGQDASATGFAADANGICFVSGWAYDKSVRPNKHYWMVRRSTDQGNSWTTLLKLTVGGIDMATAIHFVPATQSHLGGVFAVGRIGGVWTVMRTRNGGNTWTTVDSMSSISKGGAAIATAITSDSAGNLYVGGTVTTGKQNSWVSNWVVKRSTNGGDTWTSLGSPLSTDTDNEIQAMAVDGANKLWVVGVHAENTASQAWVMQRWNPSTGWNGTAYYPYGIPGTPISGAYGASVDPISGKVYVAGNVTNQLDGGSSLRVLEISN